MIAPKLHYHPLASFCWKALIALYENDTPFQPVLVDLGDDASRAALERLWPFTRFPVLEDVARGKVIPESSVIIEYLDVHHPGRTRFLPPDPRQALETRLLDRIFDTYVHEPMQKIVTDRIRPEGRRDAYGVEQAQTTLTTAYDLLEQRLDPEHWALGEAWTLADCAACPALFYANAAQPFTQSHPRLGRYLDRLKSRPSFARVLEEARPYFRFFPIPGVLT